MNADKKENYVQDDKNFQNAESVDQGQQKASSPAGRSFTDNPDSQYANDLSIEESNSRSDHKNSARQDYQKSKIRKSDLLSSDKNDNPYDSENLDNESDSESKDITEKDIEENLINNDPSEGFETDIDTAGSDKTIKPDHDNPIHKEFEIGELGNEQLKEDELTRNETGNSAVHYYKPSQRKF